jgi:hypothetical protein
MRNKTCIACGEPFPSGDDTTICNSCADFDPEQADEAHSASRATFVVRMPGASYAYFFHTNACGPQAQAVADREASKYTDQVQAEEAAIKHGLRPGQFEVCEL